MHFLLLHPLVYFFYIIVAAIPAYFFNKWLLKVIRPKDSGVRLLAYFLAAMVLAFGYTGLVTFILFRWVWPV